MLITRENRTWQFYIFKNLDRITYINLLRYSSCLVGNSSSGIIEAPTLKLPVVNIGIRQKGRFSAGNVLFVDNDENEISNAINKSVFDIEYLKDMEKIENPYGKGNSGILIANILSTVEINNDLIYKNITY